MRHCARGYSLIELMLSVVLISILMLIAVPSYQRYIERKDLAMAKQVALKIAAELEIFKSRNFSYQGFDLGQIYPSYDAAQQQLRLPIGADLTQTKYRLRLVDLDSKTALGPVSSSNSDLSANTVTAALGLGWAISIVRDRHVSGEFKQPQNYDILLNSIGLRCMTQRANQVQTFQNCGVEESQAWD